MVEPPTNDEHLTKWCRAFLAYVPQAGAERDTHLREVRSACIKIQGTPEGDDPRLTLDEASTLVAAVRTWPDGKVGQDPDLLRSDALRRWCHAWLGAPTDDADAPPEFDAVRATCEKVIATPPGEVPDLTWAEAYVVKQTLQTLSDMEVAAGITVPLRERTALGRLWDRLRGQG